MTVNYNSGERLLQTLDSLFAHTDFSQKDYFLVDNGATDNSTVPVQAKYPQINYSFTGENLGFGRGHNQVLQAILDGEFEDYDAIGLVNPDMLFTNGWLTRLVETLASEPNIAAVNPLVVYADKFNQVPLTTTNPALYLSHDDYRFLGQIVGNADSQIKEITLNGGQYIQLNASAFSALLDEKLSELSFKVYDESFVGFELDIGGKKVSRKGLPVKIKKLAYKLGFSKIDSKISSYQFPIDSLKIVAKGVEVVNSLGSGFKPGRKLPDNHYFGALTHEIPNEPHEVELFHGACVLIRADALRKVGLFDPAYFLYYEESDLGMRMGKAGYKILAEPRAKVYHLERGARSDRTLEFMQTSQKIFMEKWPRN